MILKSNNNFIKIFGTIYTLYTVCICNEAIKIKIKKK